MSAGFDRRRRTLLPERMDTEAVDAADLATCLDDLERLTRVTAGYAPTLRWIARVTAKLPPGTVPTVLDVGCGGGDMLRRLWRWSRRRGRPLRLRGIDRNPLMVALARARTPAEAPIEYATGDALAPNAGEPPDFIVSALFLHHLDEAEAVGFLRWMHGHARRGWLVNDLHRHALPYWFLRALGPFPMHPFVRHDGPVSVARGWTGAELRALAQAAGVPARLRWHMPFRWALESEAP